MPHLEAGMAEYKEIGPGVNTLLAPGLHKFAPCGS